jgi:hypothetical protein
MKVKNRSASVVVYTIADLNVSRRFAPGEVKEISKDEIQKLLYQRGGQTLFLDDLQVSAEDMRELGFGEQEPEYYYSPEDIKRIMVSGTMDEFLDLLDFSKEGGITIVKDYAVKLPLTDMNKIEALKKATGFDAAKAISHTKAVDKDLNGEGAKTLETRQRRTQPKVENTAVTNKYKIIED